MLEHIIRRRIAENKSIPVAEYMQLALAHPEYGYYMTRDPFGRAGDFTTAPEICQIFGEIIGLWCVDSWRLMGKPPSCALVELGPGRGTLMNDLLRASKMRLEFYESLSLHLVETSPVLREIQAENLRPVHLSKLWHDDLSGLPPQPAIFIANEFFDALPIRQFVNIDGVEKERHVALNEQDNLCFVPQGAVVREESPLAEEIMRNICGHIKRFGGIALIIDYGYVKDHSSSLTNNETSVGARVSPEPEQTNFDTLQAVRAQQYHPPLAMPGEADITAHVDFTRLEEIAVESGLRAFAPQPQGVFLRMLGGDMLLEKLLQKADAQQQEQLSGGYRRLVDENAMGVLFKVMAVTQKGVTQLAGW